MIFFLILCYFGLPILFLRLKKSVSIINKIGVVSVCYIAGIILGNLPFLPIDETIAKAIIGPVVALSIPLLLFNTNLKTFKTSGRVIALSFVCAILAVSISSVSFTLLFADYLDEAWKLGAMVFGVYTGGTINLSAIGLAVGVSDESFILLNAADLMTGGVGLLFFLTFAKGLYSKFLKADNEVEHDVEHVELDDKIYIKGSSISLLLAAVILGSSAALSYGIFGKINEILIFLTITGLGIAASLFPKVRSLKGSYGLGNYLLYVFCTAVGTLANIQTMLETGPTILAFVFCVVICSILLHLVLAKLFKIDADSVIIASIAGLYGPPFVAPVAKAIGSPQLIPLGITLSLVGFAVGNYGGLLLAQFLHYLLG